MKEKTGFNYPCNILSRYFSTKKKSNSLLLQIQQQHNLHFVVLHRYDILFYMKSGHLPVLFQSFVNSFNTHTKYTMKMKMGWKNLISFFSVLLDSFLFIFHFKFYITKEEMTAESIAVHDCYVIICFSLFFAGFSIPMFKDR